MLCSLRCLHGLGKDVMDLTAQVFGLLNQLLIEMLADNRFIELFQSCDKDLVIIQMTTVGDDFLFDLPVVSPIIGKADCNRTIGRFVMCNGIGNLDHSKHGISVPSAHEPAGEGDHRQAATEGFQGRFAT